MDAYVPALPDILAVVGLILLNGFFAAAEFAIISSRPAELRKTEERSPRSSRSALWLIEKLDLSLSSSQLGMTVTSLLLGWVGIKACYILISQGFAQLGMPINDEVLSIVSVSTAIVVVMFFHVVLGEIVAKSLAIRYPETTLRIIAGPIRLFTTICTPIIFVTTRTANIFLRPFGTSVPATSERFHSVSDISMLVSEGTERGVFDKDEESMIRGVFGFSETTARQVMTPRTDLVTIDISADLKSVIQTVVKSGFSRFPVMGSGVDDALGILLAKDILPIFDRHLSGAETNFHVKKVMREPYFVPGTKPIDDLLNEFKRRKIHMAIVLDEHGGVDGVVTFEDLLEEIVGDIYDESDVQLQSIVIQDDGNVIVDGATLVSELNERFTLEIPEGDYDTIAGFIFTSLGRMPKIGDTLYVNKVGGVSANTPFIAAEDSHLLEAAANGSYSSGGASVVNGGSNQDYVTSVVVSVERVTGHRIESVRIKRPELNQVSETHFRDPASEEKGNTRA